MTWMCACLAENEMEADVCSQCKKERPLYKSIIIKGEEPIERLNTCIRIKILHKYLDEMIQMKSQLNHEHGKPGMYTYFDKIKSIHKKIINLIDKTISKAEQEDPKLVDEIIDLKYNVKMEYAFSNYLFGDSYEALIEFKNAYEIKETQLVLSNIASLIKLLPLEDIPGFKIADKHSNAIQQKKDIEIRFLKKTVSIDPTSELGISAAIELIENYHQINLVE